MQFQGLRLIQSIVTKKLEAIEVWPKPVFPVKWKLSNWFAHFSFAVSHSHWKIPMVSIPNGTHCLGYFAVAIAYCSCYFVLLTRTITQYSLWNLLHSTSNSGNTQSTTVHYYFVSSAGGFPLGYKVTFNVLLNHYVHLF